MSHDHHHCKCEHTKVAYCKKCQLVYCLDCKKEWKENWTYTYQWYYPNVCTGIPIDTTSWCSEKINTDSTTCCHL